MSFSWVPRSFQNFWFLILDLWLVVEVGYETQKKFDHWLFLLLKFEFCGGPCWSYDRMQVFMVASFLTLDSPPPLLHNPLITPWFLSS